MPKYCKSQRRECMGQQETGRFRSPKTEKEEIALLSETDLKIRNTIQNGR